MNRYLFIILICLAFISCQNDIETENRDTQTHKIELSQQVIEVGCSHNTYMVDVASSCSWMVESHNDWIDIKTKGGSSYTKTLI